MTHPSSETADVGDTRIECKSFKRDLWIFESIGGKVAVRGEKRTRKWWCLWLCKRRVKRKADAIRIVNTYYTSIDGSPIPIAAAGHQRTCTDASDCRLRHWAVGFGAEVTFPNGRTTPDTADDLLPLEGVVTEATVTVDGETVSMTTAKGLH